MAHLFAPKHDELSPQSYFIYSIIFHLFLVLLISYSSDVKNLFFNKDSNKVVEQIIRVDVVGLPKLTLQELKQLRDSFEDSKTVSVGANNLPNIKEAVENIKEESVDSSNDKESALDLIKSLSQQKGASYQPKRQKKNKAGVPKKNKYRKSFKKLLVEGNKLSKGTSISGRYQSDVAEFDRYVLNLPNIIRPFWKLPSFLKEAKLNARIIVYINDSGRVVHHRFISKSGNTEFDERVIQSIERSQPFPIPISGIKDTLLSEGVILGFPL